MNRDDMLERLDELRDQQEDYLREIDAIQSEIEDLEYDIEQHDAEHDPFYEADHIADDNNQRADDLNATLRDIGQVWM